MDKLGHSRKDPYLTNTGNFCHSRQGGKETYLKEVLILCWMFGEREGSIFNFLHGRALDLFWEDSIQKLYILKWIGRELFIFSQFIYPSPEASNNENADENHGNIDGKYEHFTAMNNVVVDKVKQIMEEECSNGTQ